MVAETVVEDREANAHPQALTLIDEGLSRLQSRELVSANEVADLLLDLRTILTAVDAPLGDEKVPVTTN